VVAAVSPDTVTVTGRPVRSLVALMAPTVSVAVQADPAPVYV
jgi:hypothetical protein